ncbi:RNA-guided pseudouridylation complex pseudouridine synthase subunit Cbf5 [Candidatus Micrarchaeota archaeon]|nr:RNA-guided pseudouridylation complex pseudouridine synthase subunit Cbf5 [Candidatus Micrarchaeota archaeon]
MITLREEPANLGKKPEEGSLEELLQYGVVPVNKPIGPTSHEVSAFVRKLLHLKKTGHTGTLDADVSGVLLVLLENSCKVAKFLLGGKKRYVCIMELWEKKKRQEVEAAFSNFRGKIYQTPPLESAVVKKLRVREIFELKLLDLDQNLVLFDCECEAGTYIRKLCYDVGEVLGCGARMKELRRTKASGVDEKDCIKLQDLSDFYWLWKEKKDEAELRKSILPVEKVVDLKKVIASDFALPSICRGANLAIPGVLSFDENVKKGDFVSVFSGKGGLVCIARALMDADEIREKEKGLAFDIERVVHSFK